MLFSVIIPVYNAEKTLERCLESVKNQSFRDFEVLMVNDGSADDSKTICERYAHEDPRFRYFEQSNAGVSAARNAGIQKAGGEYIAFLDSDDVYFDDYLLSFSRAMTQFPGRDHYWCGFRYISDDAEKNGKIVKLPRTKEEIVRSDRSHIMYLHQLSLDPPLWNKIFRRKIIAENELLMPEDLSLGEDMVFNFAYLNHGHQTEIILINRALYGYHCFSENSLNRKYRSDLLAVNETLLREMERYLALWEAPEEEWQLFYNTGFYMYDSVLRNTFHGKNTAGMREKLKYNNQLLKSEKFRLYLKKSKTGISPIYRALYRSGQYLLIWAADRLLAMKKSGGD